MRTLLKYPKHFEFVGVVEPDPDQREREGGQKPYRGQRWLTEEELLATPGLEAVAVETEVRDLVPTAQRCLDSGRHVHLDKPAGESLPALEKLHATAAGKGLTIQMGYMYRYNPAFRFLFQAVRDGWLGDVFEIDTVMSKTVSAESRRGLAEYPGGSMFELGCHVIDPLLHIMGPPDRVTGFPRRTRPEQDSLADNGLAVLEYPEATATVRSAVIEVEGGKRRQFVACGDRGTIVIRPLEPPRLELTLREPRGGFEKGTQLVELPESPGRYDGIWLDFASVIRGEKTHDFPTEHDLAVQRTLLAACQLPVE
jgi:predicted dehydrogenase